MSKLNILRRLSSLVSLFLAVVFISKSVDARDTQTFKLFRLGVKASTGFTSVKSINKLANQWYDAMQEAQEDSLDYLEEGIGNSDVGDVNFEYGFQLYLTFRPWKFLQLGGKVDFIRSPHLYNLQYKDDIDIAIVSAVPGIFALYTFSYFELGIGSIWGFSEVKWRDAIFGYNDDWRGHDMGFEVYLGCSVPIRDHFGFTFQLVYRYLTIHELKDSYGRVLVDTDSSEKFEMNISGGMLNMGVYFRFQSIKSFN